MKILIVEDEELLRKVYDVWCRKLQYECLIVNNGQEALEAVGKQKFDLIITDFNMPIMNGLELITKIRNLDDTVPIALVSAGGPMAHPGATITTWKPPTREGFTNLIHRLSHP